MASAADIRTKMMAVAKVTMVLGNQVPLCATASTTGFRGKKNPRASPADQAAENPYRWVTREPRNETIVVGLSAADRL